MLHVALIAGMLYYLHACFSRIMACFDRIMAMCWPYHVHGLPVLWPCFPVSCPCFTRIKVNIITKCQHHGKNVNIITKLSTSVETCQHHAKNVNIMANMSTSLQKNVNIMTKMSTPW